MKKSLAAVSYDHKQDYNSLKWIRKWEVCLSWVLGLGFGVECEDELIGRFFRLSHND